MQEVENESAVSERRVNELEKEYAAANSDPENQEKLEELHSQISGLIGKNNLQYLREYTDRLVAQVNEDPDWFYRKGLEDAAGLNRAVEIVGGRFGLNGPSEQTVRSKSVKCLGHHFE